MTKKPLMNNPVVKDAVQCTICRANADKFENYFQCQADSYHVADLVCMIFINRTPPKDENDENYKS